MTFYYRISAGYTFDDVEWWLASDVRYSNDELQALLDEARIISDSEIIARLLQAHPDLQPLGATAIAKLA